MTGRHIATKGTHFDPVEFAHFRALGSGGVVVPLLDVGGGVGGTSTVVVFLVAVEVFQTMEEVDEFEKVKEEEERRVAEDLDVADIVLILPETE